MSVYVLESRDAGIGANLLRTRREHASLSKNLHPTGRNRAISNFLERKAQSRLSVTKLIRTRVQECPSKVSQSARAFVEQIVERVWNRIPPNRMEN